MDLKQPATKATLQDWCALHEVTPDECRTWLARTDDPGRSKPPQDSKDRFALQTVWDLARSSLEDLFPDQKSMIEHTARSCLVNPTPDIDKYPQPFTLHDSGDGRPYVSIPFDGSAQAALLLVHEFGHAVQITALDGRFAAPALREFCAMISEAASASAALSQSLPHANALHQWWEKASTTDVTRRSGALQTALNDLQTPYSYMWNYALARPLALRAWDTCDPALLWSAFDGSLSLGDLGRRVMG